MFEKLKEALSMISSNELIWLLIPVAIYHLIMLFSMFLFVPGFMKLPVISIQSDLETIRVGKAAT